jgi:hypothetical protein
MPVLSAAEMLGFRALTEELAFADSYELIGTTSTADDAGGSSSVEGVIEAGPCSVTAGLAQPDERAAGDRLTSAAPYTIELPYATQATARHVLIADGRRFEIIDVLRDGYYGTNARAVCQEVR